MHFNLILILAFVRFLEESVFRLKSTSPQRQTDESIGSKMNRAASKPCFLCLQFCNTLCLDYTAGAYAV